MRRLSATHLRATSHGRGGSREPSLLKPRRFCSVRAGVRTSGAKGVLVMRKLLIAAAALTALVIPAAPAEADRGRGHWRSGGPGMHWQGHRQWRGVGHWNGPVWRSHMRGGPRWIRHSWQSHPGWAWRGHHGWRGDPWQWRHHPRTVVLGGFGWGSGHGWGHGCRTVWFDGWNWRCGW
jgi:hypothetical protein